MAIYIGNELFTPGRPLTLKQMAAVQLSLNTGNSVDPAVLLQYNEQGGAEWIAQNSSDVVSSPPPASAAVDVLTSDTGATQNPPTPATVTVVPESQVFVARDLGPAEQSNQVTRNGGQAVADDAPGTVKTTTQTQSVSPTDGRNTPQAGGSPGVGASSDDSGTKQSTAQVIKAAASTKIIPRGNALDQYSNYTYNITWYIMEKDVYKTFFNTAKKSLNGLQILMRSGGAPNTTAGNTTTGVPGGLGARNNLFDNDYYIDNLELESMLMGPYNRSPHNVTRLKFTVTEPNGITLINNLWSAVNQVYKTTQLPYSLAQYCLAVRFYAYDQNGNSIPGKDNTNTDPNAIVERFYPFYITDIKFRVASKQVEYQVEGLPIAHYVGYGQNIGVIKQPVEISGTTVGQALGGQSQGSDPVPPSPGERTSTPTPAKTVSSIPYAGVYLSAAEMQANQDWYNKYGAQYNADGTLKG